MGVTDSLVTVRARAGAHAFKELDSSWVSSSCPFCGGNQALVVATAGPTAWLRCVTCLEGHIARGGEVRPAPKPLRDPANLPPADAALWAEVRTTLGAGAYMATVMLCRKLLLHIAVAHELPPEDDRGRAPAFAACVKHLVAEGVITKPMLRWVDQIKDVGNAASHQIEPISEQDATRVATFTLQLLVLAYEVQAED